MSLLLNTVTTFHYLLLVPGWHIKKNVGQNDMKVSKYRILKFHISDMNRSKVSSTDQTDSSGYVETSLSGDQFYLTPDDEI